MTNQEINTKIAELMGWKLQSNDTIPDLPYEPDWIDEKGCVICSVSEWNPAEKWDDAGLVLEKMSQEKWTYEITKYARNHHCTFLKWFPIENGKHQVIIHEEAKTAPMAICFASLKARGVLN